MTLNIHSIRKLLNHDVIKPSSGQHWDLLDGLRGLAILMVVACHGFYANPDGPKALKLVGDFIGAGAIGVQMFFVLSGFLISYPILKAKSENPDTWYLSGYVTRRFLKIFPPFLLCIVLLSLTYRYFDGSFERTRIGLQWLVGIPHYFYVADARNFNGSFWSLWVEIGFYVVLPVSFFILRRQANVISTACIIAALLFGGSTLSSFLTWPTHESPGEFMLFIIGRFPNGLSNFAWGVLFSALFISKRKDSTGSKSFARFGYLGLVVLLSALLWQLWASQHLLSAHWFTHAIKQLLADVATFLLLFFIFDRQALGTRIFSAPWLNYLGVISYEWFLLHQPIILLFRRYSESAGGSLAKYLYITLTPVLLTLVFAILIYHFFSAPIIEWGRKRTATKSGKV